MPFSWNLRPQALFEAGPSRIKHEFKDIFQENNRAFDGKKANLNAFRCI